MKAFFHEDDFGAVEILPVEAWVHCERQLGRIAEHDVKHRAPIENGLVQGARGLLDAEGGRHYHSGMTRRAQHVLDEALKLSPEEQSLVLREWLARLEGDPDPDAEAAWAQEIERRAQEARDGAPTEGDWETVCDEIDAELTRK